MKETAGTERTERTESTERTDKTEIQLRGSRLGFREAMDVEESKRRNG